MLWLMRYHFAIVCESLMQKQTRPSLRKASFELLNGGKVPEARFDTYDFFSPPSMILLIDPCKHESSSQRTEVEVLSSAVGVQWLRLLLGTHFWFKYLMILIKQHFNFLCDPANDPLDPIMRNNGGNELEWGGLQFSPWVLQLCGAVVEHVSWTAAIHPVALRMTWCIKAIAAAGYFVSARCSALTWAWAVLRPGLFPS